MTGILRFLSGGSREQAWGSLFLVRLLVGWVFVFAGLRKFTEPETMGTGRFAEMGFPWPGFVGPFVGFFEVLGGVLVLLGLFTRAGALPLVCIMLVAILTSKMPRFGAEGVVAGLHAARLDVSLLLASAYLLVAGGGKLAVDRLLFRKPPS